MNAKIDPLVQLTLNLDKKRNLIAISGLGSDNLDINIPATHEVIDARSEQPNFDSVAKMPPGNARQCFKGVRRNSHRRGNGQ